MESFGPSRAAVSRVRPRSGDRNRARGVGGLKFAFKKASCSVIKAEGSAVLLVRWQWTREPETKTQKQGHKVALANTTDHQANSCLSLKPSWLLPTTHAHYAKINPLINFI